MKPQNYKNHVRYYPPHHFLLLPLLAAAIVISAYHIFHAPYDLLLHTLFQVVFAWITIILVFILWVAVMLRQHYALGNQNRIVRLEMRLRYYQLTGKRLEPLEEKLSFGQIAALRFASDAELLPLMERAEKENLSPKQIKQAIQNWQGDYMRV